MKLENFRDVYNKMVKDFKKINEEIAKETVYDYLKIIDEVKKIKCQNKK